MSESNSTQRAEGVEGRARSRAAVAVRPRQLGPVWALAAGLALLAAFAVFGCGDDDDAADGTSATEIRATEHDGKIELDRAASATGNVEFAIENAGKLTHEFVVLKTDLAEDALPLTDDESAVDQSAEGIDVIAEKEEISAGTDATLAFDNLAAGDYVIICNVPGHYGLGMHTSFVVG